MSFRIAAITLLGLLTTAPAMALDQVKTAKALISGTIEEMGKYEISIKRSGGAAEKVPVNEIESIRYDAEPAKLNLIRSAVEAGRYEDAIKDLDALPTEGITRLEIKQDIEYMKIFAAAKLALSGTGDIAEVGKKLRTWVESNPGSYHFLEASELLGDLLVAVGSDAGYTAAQTYYGNLELAPWADMKMKGGVSKGRALQGQGKFAEALQVYDGVIALAANQTGELVETQNQAAIIGKSACLAETGKHEEGIKLLEDVIGKAKAENSQLHALAYNALGNCQRKAGNAKAALLAYLHVDVLYNTIPTAHAESLANLSDLWKQVGNADRALQCDQVLQERYKNTRWAKK